MRLPYAIRSTGLGIYMPNMPPIEDVYTLPSLQARVRINEPTNRYALKILKLVMEDMVKSKTNAATPTPTTETTATTDNNTEEARSSDDYDSEDSELELPTPKKNKGGRVSEKKSFHRVYRKELKLLARTRGHAYEKPTRNQIDTAWRIMSGFNGDGTLNPELSTILLHYVKFRLGIFRTRETELGAIRKSFRQYYFNVNKNATNDTFGSGSWTFPLQLMLDEHMAKENVPRIAFSTVRAEEETGHDIRSRNSKIIWIYDKPEGASSRKIIDISVERREACITALIAWADKRHHVQLEPPVCQGKPAGVPDPKSRPSPLKRSFREYASDLGADDSAAV